MANNARPDSIIMNMVCRSLVVPPVEPKVRSTEVTVALTCKNTLRILNTIKPVIRAFTAMDKAELVIVIVLTQVGLNSMPCTSVIGAFCAIQIARRRQVENSLFKYQ